FILNLLDASPVVVCHDSNAILDIRRGECRLSRKIVAQPGFIEFRQVLEVSDVLLNRPPVPDLRGEKPGRKFTNNLVQAGGSSPQPLDDRWEETDRKVAAEAPFDPFHLCNHFTTLFPARRSPAAVLVNPESG